MSGGLKQRTIMPWRGRGLETTKNHCPKVSSLNGEVVRG